MANSYFPEIVQPTIPISDMTPLELLVLSQVYDEPDIIDNKEVYFTSSEGTASSIWLNREEAADALISSQETPSCLNELIEDAINTSEDGEFIVNIPSYVDILHDIVKRSTSLTHISIQQATYCDKMRPDSVGGGVILITKDAVRSQTTSELLTEWLRETRL